MKKFVLFAVLMLASVATKAQFEAGTKYLGLSTTSLGLSYSTVEKFRANVGATAGYFIADKVLLKADLGYDHTEHIDDFFAGMGGRYYFRENGIFLGAGLEFNHLTKNNNDLKIPVEVGYAFYLNHYITIEPSLYYKMSFDDFSDKSTVGIKLGFGFYF